MAIVLYGFPPNAGAVGTAAYLGILFLLGITDRVTGAELAQRGYQQAWVFGARFLMMQEVTALRAEGEGYDGIGRGRINVGGRLTLRIFDSHKPVIGAINGAAVGVGVTMQLPMDRAPLPRSRPGR